jgi:hypothetical protein
MYLSSTQVRHLLYVSHPPPHSHVYNMWQKLKLRDAFRNVLISLVASSLCRRHWRHRKAYWILRQIVARRLVNPHSKSWSTILHSNLTAHLNIISNNSGARCWWRSGWGTALQTGRSRDRFPMVSLEFFIDIILPAALWLWGRLSL